MNKILEYIKQHKKNIIIVLLVLLISYLIYIIFIESNDQKEIQTFQNTRQGKKYNEIVLSENPKIILIENFVTEEEANHLIKLADEIKRPSTIDTKDDPYTLVNNVRSSESAHLGKARDKIVEGIENKACDYVNLNTHYLEPMQVVVYEKGQKFNPHYDFFSADSQDLPIRGNRNKTILVYLNNIDKEYGGATVFPKINLRIQPKAYSAIYFENMNGTEVDYNTLHAGEELKTDKLKKYAINIWFREKESW
jgi:prolyl 4-hydroxylase